MIFGFRPIFGMILGFVFALSLVLSVCRIAISHAWKPDLGHEIGHESVRFACGFTVLLQSPSRCGGNRRSTIYLPQRMPSVAKRMPSPSVATERKKRTPLLLTGEADFR